MDIRFEKSLKLKEKIKDENKLGFGTYFTDYMFLMDYDEKNGWNDPRIVPYGNIEIQPSAMGLHYGQTIFEGLKAYKNDGKVYLFRADENFKRMNESNDRLCIPPVDEEFMMEALKKLIDIERDWVPDSKEASLYIRPFIIATEPKLGVHPSDSYLLMIILSPSGPYYKDGLAPMKIYVEDKYVRAVKGGIGTAKAGGNYAASLKSQIEAEENGYFQVLWIDGVDRKYVEEVGSMNIFFVTDDGIITPELNGSILSGITRKSIIELLKAEGQKVVEKKIAIDEIMDLHKKGKLLEVFGTGTAAVVSPVGELFYNGEKVVINNGEIGKVSQHLYDELTDIQWARKKGPEGWQIEV
ncbi:branched chain amino acid aminotransferase apoenzyme [Anaerosphaera aminiphila DSM 21120]|uniref:Branched-chain-amino-acid aminotransferase n=1 Tax=Anaerosphaera aminiphila DSM 21120 TaxID=1120995 RepID=A0A1M5R754_9FIRM|nr:branched-chain amino acid aminotransferase [Anaerosphaera aminiphila]SHH22051.1 branched chain amino acid aminotransferase apoenzyme [Anaerosphaera aminiphila DSM 21120]